MNIIIYLIHLKYTVFYIILGPYLQKWRGWVVRNMNCCLFFILQYIYFKYILNKDNGEGRKASQIRGEGPGLWWVPKRGRWGPRRELGEVLSTGQSLTWVVDMAVVAVSGRRGGGRRGWWSMWRR